MVVVECHGYIPHLNTCVSLSQSGLLSPTHDSSPTCYLIKTHCPFLYFEETSLSTWLSTVTISTDPTHSCNNIYFLHTLSVQYNCVSLSLLWQHQVMNNHSCWYALIACGLRGRFVVQFTATRRPTKVQEMEVYLHWQDKSRKKQALRKSHSSGIHNGRLEEIRLNMLSQVCGALDSLWAESLQLVQRFPVDRHTFHWQYNYSECH